MPIIMMDRKWIIIAASMLLLISCGDVSWGIYFNVGGDVSGLEGTVVIQDSFGAELIITANERFTFPTQLADGTAYSVTVKTHPTGQTCTVSNGSGIINGASANNVSIVCSSAT